MPQNVREHARNVALGAVAVGKSYEAAAEVAGVTARTVTRWASSSEWKDEVRRRQDEAVSKAVEELADASADAVATLRTLMKSAKSEGVRLAAARAVLDVGLKFRDEVELRRRVEDLERHFGIGRDANDAA